MANCINSVQGLAQGETATLGVSSRIIRVDDACIVEVNGRFFLIAAIVFDTFERVIVIRVTREQAMNLMRNGIRNCPIFFVLPADIQRRAVDLQCVFVVGDEAFLVFETERSQERLERLFVVRVPLCAVVGREC